MGIFIESKNQNMKLFSILALATASQAYTVFGVGADCDPAADPTTCGKNEACLETDKKFTCACLPGYGSEAAEGKDCEKFTCNPDICNGGKCAEDLTLACDCSEVEACIAEGAECDAYCSVPTPPPEETTAGVVETTTAGNSTEDASAFATLSAVAMAILLA